MHDVFISYSFSNKHTADAICHYFEARDLRCWYAPRDVDAAKDFRAEIMNAIASSKCFVLVYTKDSNHSRDVMNEITAAFNAKIPILPLRIEDVEMEPALAYYLNGIHWLDALTPPMENNIRTLYKAVCRIVGKEIYEPVEACDKTADFTPEPPAEDPGIPVYHPEPAPAPKKNWLIPAIAGAAAVLVLAVIIAIAGRTGPTTPDPTLSPTVSDPTVSTMSETIASDNEVNPFHNTLMENRIHKNEAGEFDATLEMNEYIFNTKITRRQVKTITFLDTLSSAPANAADASALENGKVKAWAVIAENADLATQEDPKDPTSPTTVESVALYDLYIAAEGGVWAPANSNILFGYLPNLVSIDFGTSFHTENVTYMGFMFAQCTNLRTLDLTGFNTSNVTSMDCMFVNCTQLTSLDLSGWQNDNVNNMHCMFSYCKQLTDLTLTGFRTPQVEDMSYMFSECWNLPKLVLSGFDTSNVINMRAMFYRCRALTGLEVPNFVTTEVSDMSYMFADCASRSTVDVSHFDTSKVTEYKNFMNSGDLIDGQPWETLFS